MCTSTARHQTVTSQRREPNVTSGKVGGCHVSKLGRMCTGKDAVNTFIILELTNEQKVRSATCSELVKVMTSWRCANCLTQHPRWPCRRSLQQQTYVTISGFLRLLYRRHINRTSQFHIAELLTPNLRASSHSALYPALSEIPDIQHKSQ